MRSAYRVWFASIAAALVLGGLGCGSDDKADDGKHTVVITDEGYEPDDLTIEVGDQVKFVNRSKELPHSAKDDRRGPIDVSPESDGETDHSGKDINYANKTGFGTHSLFPGEPQRVVFRAVRDYSYYCAFHPNLRGTIEVVEKEG
jgi:plastocyanin